SGNVFFYQSAGPGTAAVGGATFIGKPATPVMDAPYSATITNESVQTLADGTRIVNSTSGSTARDSQGRTRQDAPLPVLGNLSAADAPHIVFITDPVSQTRYTLNLTDKTAQKMPAPPIPANLPGPMEAPGQLTLRVAGSPPDGPMPPPAFAIQSTMI